MPGPLRRAPAGREGSGVVGVASAAVVRPRVPQGPVIVEDRPGPQRQGEAVVLTAAVDVGG